MPDDSPDGRGRLTSRHDAGERPAFGIPDRGKFIVVIAVVSAAVGMMLFAGGTIGGLIGRRAGTPIWIGAGLGAIFGVLGGTWIALGLADISKTLNHLAATAVGGFLGLFFGVLLPVILKGTNIPFFPVIAILSPGTGAAFGTAAALHLESRRG